MQHANLMTVLVLKVTLALGVVLVLVGVAAWAARKMGVRPSGARSPLGPELLATTHLGPRQTLHLVRVCGNAVLVGASRDGLTSLGIFPLASATDAPARPDTARLASGERAPFLDYIESALRGGKKNPPREPRAGRHDGTRSANNLTP